MPNTYQLYEIWIDYEKNEKMEKLDQGKSLSLFAWWHGRGGILKKVTNGDIRGRGPEIWYFCGDFAF